MSSRSSNEPEPLVVGRVRGHRGTRGELTVRVLAGDAAVWKDQGRVWIGGKPYEVEHSRCYGDRWVLKLAGIDDAGAAEDLRSATVTVPLDEAPELADGEIWAARLVGAVVVAEDGGRLGTVRDVVPTGGTDLLLVVPDAAHGGAEAGEWMIPMAPEIVLTIDLDAGRVVVRPPEGLLELNRGASDVAEETP